ncbi:MAG TPA: thioesterase family protein [archaeon]|nr:thioesterase family protein [archaeon]
MERLVETCVSLDEFDGLYGHVKYDVYLRLFKEGHLDLLGSIGITLNNLKKKYDLGNAVRRVEIEYKEPILYGDRIQVLTRLSRIGHTSIDYSQRIKTRNKEVATAHMTVVFVSVNSITGRHNPVQIPEDIRHKLKDYLLYEEKYDDFGAPIESGS